MLSFCHSHLEYIFVPVGNLDRLLKKFETDQRTKKIVEVLNSGPSTRILLNGIVGAQDAFVLSGCFQAKSSKNYLVICNDKQSAAYLQNSLGHINEHQTIHFFPDSFKRPMNFEEVDRNNIQFRTEAMNKFSLKSKRGEILISYPEAVFEKVVDPAILFKERIEISKNESLDTETIFEILIEYGFERVEYVYEPGQFSVRGGIVDIFTFGSEWPYRIELFDDEVESIRHFNPTTQLSVRSISKLSVIPHIGRSFTKDQKISIFDVLDQNTVLWLQDLDFILDKLQICFEKVNEFANDLKKIEDGEAIALVRERAFIYPHQIMDQMRGCHIVFFRESQAKIDFDLKINYDANPQPSFNKNFNLLIEDLRKNENSGFENFIFTDNSKQIERFYSIFEDLGASLNIHPVLHAIHEGFVDKALKVVCFTDHQIFERFHRYRLRKGFTKDQAMSLRMLKELRRGDFVVHIDHGVGKYSGLEKININGQVQESVRLIYKNNDLLYVSINSLHKISKFVGKEGTPPRLDKIGSDTWKALKRKTKRKVKDIAKELIKLYAKRKTSKGVAFEKDGYMQNELEASFIYEDTPDQLKATQDVKEDMQKSYPMDRLICGDVGFGKTEVAIRAAFKAALSGKQVAVLVPTTILALQHFETFNARLKEFGVEVDYVNRFRSTAEKKGVFEKLKEGKIDIVIGTHAILNKQIGFKDLGLLIVDEEQKFGVAAKERLRNIKVNVDTLTLTATPIPRTLQFSLMAARDLSIIRTAPPNRQPIHTERRIFSDELIKEAIYFEVNRGGQVFFVHNRVKNLAEMSVMLKRLCPDITFAVAHGQMESKKLEETLIGFIHKKYDVLVCTNIIETGLDIANANTIIINNAHQFGLSDLHQLRGRVGRSNRKAYCYLFAPPLSVLTAEARKRLKTIEEFSELGSGFNIAMRDMDIRGAGNLLGGEQSGFIADIGYETYQKILEEAITELKQSDFKELFKEELSKERDFSKDVEIDTDIEMLIPDSYISNIQERLRMYTELDGLKNEEEVIKFRNNLKDRFGKYPNVVNELFNGIRIRWICRKMGIERLSVKNRKLRCFFIKNQKSFFYESNVFKGILKYVSTIGVSEGIHLKQSRDYLILVKDGINNLKEARLILTKMLNYLNSEEESLSKLVN